MITDCSNVHHFGGTARFGGTAHFGGTAVLVEQHILVEWHKKKRLFKKFFNYSYHNPKPPTKNNNKKTRMQNQNCRYAHVVRRGNQWITTCPFCNREHQFGIMNAIVFDDGGCSSSLGPRNLHCHGTHGKKSLYLTIRKNAHGTNCANPDEEQEDDIIFDEAGNAIQVRFNVIE